MLFFPNAPYILTDLFHLKSRTSSPIWFDLVLILSFAWTGLLFGFISLSHIERMIGNFCKPLLKNSIVMGLLFLSSFGIYLGRFLRWNSWHIVNKPTGLFNDIADRILAPTAHPRTWGVTIFFGILLNMIYFSIKIFRNESKN